LTGKKKRLCATGPMPRGGDPMSDTSLQIESKAIEAKIGIVVSVI